MRRAAGLGGLTTLMLAIAAPAQAQFAPSWTGLYAGAIAGFARSRSSIDAAELAGAGITTPASVAGATANGAGFGVGGGMNWQTGPLVFGIEGDWSVYSLRTSIPFAGTIAPFGAVSGTLGAELDWLVTARARAGIAIGRALLYGTGGLAFAGASGEVTILGLGTPITYSDRVLLAGWALGGGIEYALSSTWSVKGEFLHTRIGGGPFASAGGGVPISSRIDLFNLRGGLNYKF